MPIEPETEDFWPDITASAIITPASILKAQAAVLTRKSKGLIQAEVVSDPPVPPMAISHRLVLFVPALQNYRYTLLRIQHAVTPVYPLVITEGPINFPPQIKDEANFRSWLREALSSERTKNVLDSLLAQATA